MIRRRMTVKRVDPWSVLKLGLVVNIAGAAILVVTGMVVWSVVRRLRLVERVCEQAQGLLGFETCAVDGVSLMRSGLMLAGLSVVVATGVMVFLAFLYNLIADLTGGIEVSMLDHSGQARTAGGVEVAPELRRETGRSARAAPPATDPRPVPGLAATERSDPQSTMASPTARPHPELPLAQAGGPGPSGPPAPKGPSVLARATGAVGAAGAAVKQAAERSGAAVRDAAVGTGAKLSEAGRRATTTLAEVTEPEAADRAERARAARLDQLAVTGRDASSPGGGRGGSSSGRPRPTGSSGTVKEKTPPRGDDGRFVPSDESSHGSSRGGPGGSGGRRSPQEAAAERQRAKAARAREAAKSSRGGRPSGSAGRSDQSSRSSSDDEPELMFGNHPRAKPDDDS